MATIWMAVVVTLLGTSGGTTPPQIRVSPEGFYSADACDQWKASMDAQKPELVDGPSGKPVIAKFNHCTPIRADEMASDLAAAIKKYQ